MTLLTTMMHSNVYRNRFFLHLFKLRFFRWLNAVHFSDLLQQTLTYPNTKLLITILEFQLQRFRRLVLLFLCCIPVHNGLECFGFYVISRHPVQVAWLMGAFLNLAWDVYWKCLNMCSFTMICY